MRVGFIGLGTMGSSMALNLRAAGHDLIVHDIRRAAGTAHLQAGAAWLSATACAEIEEDDNGLTWGTYVPAAAPDQQRDFDPDYRCYLMFDELRRRTRKPGHALWVKARFTLQPDGHFDLDFTYPDDGSE